MEHSIVSGIDRKTVIGKCNYDKKSGKFCDFRKVENEGTFMELAGVNIYDNDEVYRCGDYLHLKHHIGFKGAGPAFIYDIELSRLNTPKKVYQWVMHLLEKNWITLDMLHRMICILEKHFGYNLHEFTDAAQGD